MNPVFPVSTRLLTQLLPVLSIREQYIRNKRTTTIPIRQWRHSNDESTLQSDTKFESHLGYYNKDKQHNDAENIKDQTQRITFFTMWTSDLHNFPSIGIDFSLPTCTLRVSYNRQFVLKRERRSRIAIAIATSRYRYSSRIETSENDSNKQHFPADNVPCSKSHVRDVLRGVVRYNSVRSLQARVRKVIKRMPRLEVRLCTSGAGKQRPANVFLASRNTDWPFNDRHRADVILEYLNTNERPGARVCISQKSFDRAFQNRSGRSPPFTHARTSHKKVSSPSDVNSMKRKY